jgi:hypothetical protein
MHQEKSGNTGSTLKKVDLGRFFKEVATTAAATERTFVPMGG